MDRQQERTDRHQQLAAEVAARLRPACAHLPEAAFSELVQDIADMKMRFREIDAQTKLWQGIDRVASAMAPLPPSPTRSV
jgi:hypothetical protein